MIDKERLKRYHVFGLFFLFSVVLLLFFILLAGWMYSFFHGENLISQFVLAIDLFISLLCIYWLLLILLSGVSYVCFVRKKMMEIAGGVRLAFIFNCFLFFISLIFLMWQ